MHYFNWLSILLTLAYTLLDLIFISWSLAIYFGLCFVLWLALVWLFTDSITDCLPLFLACCNFLPTVWSSTSTVNGGDAWNSHRQFKDYEFLHTFLSQFLCVTNRGHTVWRPLSAVWFQVLASLISIIKKKTGRRLGTVNQVYTQITISMLMYVKKRMYQLVMCGLGFSRPTLPGSYNKPAPSPPTNDVTKWEGHAGAHL